MTIPEGTTSDVAGHIHNQDSASVPKASGANSSGKRHLPEILTRDDEGRPIAQPERLTSTPGDSMTLHTTEALRLFVGQAGDARWRIEALAGGKHFASALKELWFLSSRDHPYADWLLIRAYDDLAALRRRTADATDTLRQRLDQIRCMGLSMGILESPRAVTVALGFRSPYGYSVASAIVEFDYYVRLVQTLVQKDQWGPQEGKVDLLALSKRYHDLFGRALKWKRLLLSDVLKPMTRRDFGAEADEAAVNRVRVATGFFGPLPRNVLSREVRPRHDRRASARQSVTTDRAAASESIKAEMQSRVAAADGVYPALSDVPPVIDASRETTASVNSDTVMTAADAQL